MSNKMLIYAVFFGVKFSGLENVVAYKKMIFSSSIFSIQISHTEIPHHILSYCVENARISLNSLQFIESDFVYRSPELRNDAMYTSVDQVVKVKMFDAIRGAIKKNCFFLTFPERARPPPLLYEKISKKKPNFLDILPNFLLKPFWIG